MQGTVGDNHTERHVRNVTETDGNANAYQQLQEDTVAGDGRHLSRSSFFTSRRLFCRFELNVSIASMISFIFCFLARFRS
jgi:hypothetical protein